MIRSLLTIFILLLLSRVALSQDRPAWVSQKVENQRSNHSEVAQERRERAFERAQDSFEEGQRGINRIPSDYRDHARDRFNGARDHLNNGPSQRGAENQRSGRR